MQLPSELITCNEQHATAIIHEILIGFPTVPDGIPQSLKRAKMKCGTTGIEAWHRAFSITANLLYITTDGDSWPSRISLAME